MFYVDAEERNENSHKLCGWFPTRELAEMHVKSWNADISKGLIVIPGSYIVSVVERHPPEHLQKSVAKALNDHNASVARMVSHGDDAFRYKPQEPDAVVEIESKVTDGWRPWDTAPTDGTYFDAWVEPSKRDEKARRIPHVTFDHDGFWVGDEGYVYELGTPTHWRPEPEAPKK